MRPDRIHHLRRWFENGYGVSIVTGERGTGLYGEFVRRNEEGELTFEMAVLHARTPDGYHRICYASPITQDVLGWLTKDETRAAAARVRALPRNDTCTHEPPNPDYAAALGVTS